MTAIKKVTVRCIKVNQLINLPNSMLQPRREAGVGEGEAMMTMSLGANNTLFSISIHYEIVESMFFFVSQNYL